MWLDKLADGVVRVQTPIGPRYVMPSFLQRIYLLWMFRHFAVLPHNVLAPWQQRMIDKLCVNQKFESMAYSDALNEVPIIGTIERRPPMPPDLPPRRPAASEGSRGLAAEVRQRP